MTEIEYAVATAEKAGDDQVIIFIKGPLDSRSQIIDLSVEHFKALYRLVFSLIEEQVTEKYKEEAKPNAEHGALPKEQEHA
jgi:hypothetical protein